MMIKPVHKDFDNFMLERNDLIDEKVKELIQLMINSKDVNSLFWNNDHIEEIESAIGGILKTKTFADVCRPHYVDNGNNRYIPCYKNTIDPCTNTNCPFRVYK